MPYKDPKKKAEADKKSVEKIYITTCGVRFRKDDSEFYDAICRASEAESVTVAEYLRISARKRLVDDGYLTKDSKTVISPEQ